VESISQELSFALNTLYSLMTATLVVGMVTGFTLLEYGLAFHPTQILSKHLASYAVASLIYLGIGYDLMFSSPEGELLPSFKFLFSFMLSVHQTTTWSNGMESLNVAENAFFFFQMMGTLIAVYIVSSAMTDRLKLGGLLCLVAWMAGVIYPVQGYWNWGGGFLESRGFIDFAGAGTIHLTGATAVLSGMLLWRSENSATANCVSVPLATLGTLLVWGGWLGFNGGSQLVVASVEDANLIAAVWLNTHLAAVGGLISGGLVSHFLKAPNLLLRGVVAGLIAISAEPITPTPGYAVLVGMVGGGLVSLGIWASNKRDLGWHLVITHGLSGMWGLLVVALTNSSQASWWIQFMGLAVIFSWVFVTSFIFLLIVKLISPRTF